MRSQPHDDAMMPIFSVKQLSMNLSKKCLATFLITFATFFSRTKCAFFQTNNLADALHRLWLPQQLSFACLLVVFSMNVSSQCSFPHHTECKRVLFDAVLLLSCQRHILENPFCWWSSPFVFSLLHWIVPFEEYTWNIGSYLKDNDMRKGDLSKKRYNTSLDTLWCVLFNSCYCALFGANC